MRGICGKIEPGQHPVAPASPTLGASPSCLGARHLPGAHCQKAWGLRMQEPRPGHRGWGWPTLTAHLLPSQQQSSSNGMCL